MKKYLMMALVFGCEPGQANATPKRNFHIEENNVCPAEVYWQHCAVLHDDKRNVTCWAMWQSNGDAMQCIPDWQLTQPAK